MIAKDAIENQARIAKHYDLGWWYGTKCKKCCGVYPKLMTKPTQDPKNCYYQCEVCGRRTALYTMPYLAEQAWNNDEVEHKALQMSLF